MTGKERAKVKQAIILLTGYGYNDAMKILHSLVANTWNEEEQDAFEKAANTSIDPQEAQP